MGIILKEDEIKAFYADYDSHMCQISSIEHLLNYCYQIKCSDISKYWDYLKILKSNLNNTLQKVKSPEAWIHFSKWLDIADKLYRVSTSLTIKNIFNKVISNYSNIEITVEIASSQIIPESIELHSKIWSQYMLENPVNIPVNGIMKLWDGLKADNIEHEFILLQKELNLLGTIATRKALGTYAKKQTIVPQCQLLLQLFKMFDVTYGDSHKIFFELDNFIKDEEKEKKDEDELIIFDDFDKNIIDKKSRVTLAEIATAIEKAEGILIQFPDVFLQLIMLISLSENLITFLKQIRDEDLRNLIDSVEERSETLIDANVVSDLIVVKRVLHPLLSFSKLESSEEFLKTLREVLLIIIAPEKNVHRNSLDTAAEMKVYIFKEQFSGCNDHVNGLMRLYANVANRGEVTKEMIHNSVYYGTFEIKISPSLERENFPEKSINITLKYTRHGKDSVYSFDDIQDLRGRALLLVNSVDKDELKKEMEMFIQIADLINGIHRILIKIISFGVFGYSDFSNKVKGYEEILKLQDIIVQDLNEWESALNDARQQYYYMTYVQSHQLYSLHALFISIFDKSAVISQEHISKGMSVLKFINPNIKPDEKHLNTFKYIIDPKNPRIALNNIGQCLDYIFKKTKPHNIPMAKISDGNIRDHVEKGIVRVLTVNDKERTINTIMSIYGNYGFYPNPSQVIFCLSSTVWEQLYLLLLRCFFSKSELFCIANVESIGAELQYKLVDSINELIDKHPKEFRLAIICVDNNSQHHILEKFPSVHSSGISEKSVKRLFEELCNNVNVVTSDWAGLGKTEIIKHMAYRQKRSVRIFPISGPITRDVLVRRLCEIKLLDFEALHLDISPVEDKELLDVFFFELLVLGTVTSSSEMYHLNKSIPLYIEIANTCNHEFLNSLKIMKYLRIMNLKWNINTLIVSLDRYSSIQIVCTYLNLYDKDILNKTDVYPPESDVNKTVINRDTCIKLLQKYFCSQYQEMSYAILKIFLNVFADQLRYLSFNNFFRVKNIEAMLHQTKNAENLRQLLVKSLLVVSSRFAVRSVHSVRASQLSALSQKEAAILRLNQMDSWSELNPFLLFFNSVDGQTISTLYRNTKAIPREIKKVIKTQVRGGLQDLENLPQDKLLKRLIMMTRTSPSKIKNLDTNYSITLDNLLKMALIILRIRAKVPVIIMGETGCGKTSLLKFLADISGAVFRNLPIHAGITENDIISFTVDSEELCKKSTENNVWVFFDEINTCEHLGLINEIVCHHRLLGRPLHPNVIFIAACNPYRYKNPDEKTAGFSGKIIWDEKSKLVYRVEPLPDSMLDYVWDYGTLHQEHEQNYIKSMVRDLPLQNTIAMALFKSQEFIRKVSGNSWCVSLRDVSRCIKLIKFFMETEKVTSGKGNYNYVPKNMRNYKSEYVHEICAFCLGIAHCYHTQLGTAELRKQFRTEIAKLFSETKFAKNPHSPFAPLRFSEDSFRDILYEEQYQYLTSMELPPRTAKNQALMENVFILIICILNRIPVFLVGKSGCSKSLSMQLIRSNLRGPDSSFEWLKKLPQVYVVAYQGSESSTSEGILKVFDKAQQYYEANKSENVIPVVLLDEVGLAEISPANPLKVLHSLLEPNERKISSDNQINYSGAVVGISNWSLDAAKMNRAIHLLRPDPDVNDLYETGKAILFPKEKYSDIDKISDNSPEACILKSIAKAYYEYHKIQKYSNFHGLRDYYSLLKSLPPIGFSTRDFVRSLERNFGGLRSEMKIIREIFFSQDLGLVDDPNYKTPVLDLISDNISEVNSRHLMLITNGDVALNLVLKNLRGKKNRKHVSIYGSSFSEDWSEQYCYRILNDIIVCMEEGHVLILKNLDAIYGSLYDMLNQNYTIINGKNNCRIALGAYSNPMCYVHQDFRCIVLVESTQVTSLDPPFLNRFEKQQLFLEDVMTDKTTEYLRRLTEWIEMISVVSANGYNYGPKEMFMGFNENTLASCVLKYSIEENDEEIILEKCQYSLLNIATAYGISRLPLTKMGQYNPSEMEKYRTIYLEQSSHKSLEKFIEEYLNSNSIFKSHVIFTNSSLNTPILPLFKNHSAEIEKLGIFKNERVISDRIKYFFEKSKREVFVLQCDSATDSSHIMLVKYLFDRYLSEYFSEFLEEKIPKSVILIIHMRNRYFQNETISYGWNFNFLSGWNLVSIDNLVENAVNLSNLYRKSLSEVLLTDIYPFRDIVSDVLFWCFTCIKYPQYNNDSMNILNHIINLQKKINSSEAFLRCLKIRVLQWIENNVNSNWLLDLAINEKCTLHITSFQESLSEYIKKIIRKPIAMLLFVLERDRNILPYFESEGNSELKAFWEQLFLDKSIYKIDGMLEPEGEECYELNGNLYKFTMPFSYYFMRKIDEIISTNINFTNFVEDDIIYSIANETLLWISEPWFEHHYEKYFNDFITLKCVPFAQKNFPNPENTLKWLLYQHGLDEKSDPIRIHIFWRKNVESISHAMHLISSCLSVVPVEELLSVNQITSQNIGDYLAEFYCQKLIPTKKTISICDGIDKWHLITYNVLSYIGNLSRAALSSPILHMIRTCRYCYDHVILPHGIGEEILILLSDIYTMNKEKSFHNSLSIKSIHKIISSLKHNQKSDTVLSLDSFLSEYLGHILDVSGITLFQEILDVIITTPNIPMIAPLFVRIFYFIENEDEGILEDIILRRKELEENNKLSSLNVALLVQKNYESLSVIICDVLKEIFHLQPKQLLSEEFASEFAKEGTFISEIADKFDSAIAMLLKKDVTKPLLTVTSLAYLKSFIHALVPSLVDEYSVEKIHPQFIDQINAFSTHRDFKENILQLYLLKEMRAILSLKDMKYILRNDGRLSKIFPWINELPWTVSQSPIGFPIVSDEIRIKTNMWENFSKNNKDWFSFVSKAEANMEYAYALLSYIIERILLPRHNEQSTYIVDFISWYDENKYRLRGFSMELNSYLQNCIFNNFNQWNFIRVDNEKTSEEIFLLSVIHHLIARLQTLPIISPIVTCLFQPSLLLNSFLPTYPNKEEFMGSHAHTIFCHCGYLFRGITSKNGIICPRCSEVHLISEEISSKTKNDDVQLFDIFFSLSTQELLYTPRDTLSPLSYRVLSLLMSIALTYSITLSINHVKNSVILKFIMNNNEIWRFNRFIKIKLNEIATILDNGRNNEPNMEIACRFLHTIIDQLHVLPPMAKCSNQQELLEYEVAFDALCYKILNIPSGITSTYREKTNILLEVGYGPLERKLEEQDPDDEISENFILRFAQVPTFNHFRLSFLKIPGNSSKFPFLDIFFKYERYLSLLKYLYPILHWTNLVLTRLNYTVHPSDSNQILIKDFIGFNNELKTSFTTFQEAWSALSIHVLYYKGELLHPPMKQIQMDINQLLSYSFVKQDYNSNGIYICAVFEYLSNLQNNFIDKLLETSKGKKSLNYFQKRECIISAIPIQELNKNSIMYYNWDDRWLKFSQNNKQYGCGGDINYDFQKIEMQIAHSLVFDVSYIITQNITYFSYSIELFHGHGTILLDISEKIPQIPIPNELQTGILKVITSENLPKLLGLLNKILYLLKHTGGSSEKNLGYYFARFFNDGGFGISSDPIFSAFLKTEILMNIPLRQVVSLYHMTEEIISQNSIFLIEKTYRTPLPNEIYEMTTIPPLASYVITTAVQRFAYRYINNQKISPGAALVNYLMDKSLWPMITSSDHALIERVLTTLPPSIKVCHTYEFHEYLVNQKKHQISRNILNKTPNKQNPFLMFM